MRANGAKGDLEKALTESGPAVKVVCDGLTGYLATQARAFGDAAKEIEKRRVAHTEHRCGSLNAQSVCVGDSGMDRVVYANALGQLGALETSHTEAREAVAAFCAVHVKLEQAAANGAFKDDDATYAEVAEAVKATHAAAPTVEVKRKLAPKRWIARARRGIDVFTFARPGVEKGACGLLLAGGSRVRHAADEHEHPASRRGQRRPRRRGAALLAGCGSDSASSGTPPTISALSITPMDVTVGMSNTLTASLTVDDPEGDESEVDVTIKIPSGASQALPPTMIQGAGATTAVPLQVFLVLDPPTAGAYDLTFQCTDAEGNQSNALSTTVTAH